MSESPLQLNVQNAAWNRSTLTENCVFIKDGTHGTHIRHKTGVPLLSAKNITSSGKVSWDLDDSLVSEDDYAKIHAKYELKKNDVLLTVVGTLGRRALVENGQKFTIQRSVAAIRLKEHILLPRFLFQFIATDYFQHQLELRSNATAQAGVYLGELAKISVPVPDIREQQKIAAILTAIDDVIESTQAQINKLKDLKTGMMQELLTKGIGHTEFKDSLLGLIPTAWQVTTFGKIAIKIQDGTHFSPQSKEGECLYITSKNIQDGKLDLRRIQYISKAEHDEIYKRCSVQYGDVLLTKDGANTGNCAINTLAEPFSLLSSVAFLRCDERICLNKFLYHFILSITCQKMIADSMTGNAITRMTLTIINGLSIVLPPVDEQRAIVNALDSVDVNIDNRTAKLNAHLKQKKALMQDLLTGKVRVSVN